MKNKKGVELTLNTMIIAIICLIVLVVVVVIFSNGMSDGWGKIQRFGECEAQGGSCIASSECTTGTKLPGAAWCGDNTLVCCIPQK